MALSFKPVLGRSYEPHLSHYESEQPNVNNPERIASAITGAFLIYNAVRNIRHAPVSSISKVLAGGVLLYRGTSGHCPVYDKLGKNTNVLENVNIKSNFTVNKPRAEVYEFWRRLENLPLFMRHLESVDQLDDKRSHWKAKIPGGIGTISWNAEIVEDKQYFIGWQSVEGSDIFNAGKVEFKDAPAGQGTEIQAVISYKAPAGAFGTQVAKLLNPVFENIVREDVRNFKQFIETGEIPTIEGQPSGRKGFLDKIFKAK